MLFSAIFEPFCHFCIVFVCDFVYFSLLLHDKLTVDYICLEIFHQ